MAEFSDEIGEDELLVPVNPVSEVSAQRAFLRAPRDDFPTAQKKNIGSEDVSKAVWVIRDDVINIDAIPEALRRPGEVRVKAEVPDKIFEKAVWKKIHIDPHVTEDQRCGLWSVMYENRHVFSTSVNLVGNCTIIQHQIVPDTDKTDLSPTVSGMAREMVGNYRRREPFTGFGRDRGINQLLLRPSRSSIKEKWREDDVHRLPLAKCSRLAGSLPHADGPGFFDVVERAKVFHKD